MRAVILAAGKGNRLRPLTDHTHKCLLEFGGRTLLQRYLDHLADLGITRATLVLGHLADNVRDHVETYGPSVEVDYVMNHDHHRGSILSVALAADHFDDDIIMMDCDVVYHPTLLERLINSAHESCYLMDTDYQETGEECKVAAHSGRVVANNRNIHEPFDMIGEGIGFLKLSKAAAQQLADILQGFVARGDVDCEYEDALELLLKQTVVGYELVAGLPWTEIDFASDIERARAVTLPAIANTLPETL